MARIDNLTNFLTDIANAIRTKKETDVQIQAEQFDAEILSIETGSQINNQNKTFTENGDYTADEGYTGLGTVKVNVSQKVKLFDDRQVMNTFLNEHYDELNIDDKAVVYGKKSIVPIGNEMMYTSIYLPQTIVLDEPLTTDITFYNGQKSDHGGGGGNNYITPTEWNMYMHLNMAGANFTYTSEDGKTFIRGDVNVEGFGGWGASFIWDEDTDLLSIDESTNDENYQLFYRAVNGHTDILMQFFKTIKPVFDGIYNIEEEENMSVRRVGQTGTNFVNNNIVTPNYAYIPLAPYSYNNDMFGIKTGSEIIQGIECDTFTELYQTSYSNITLVYDNSKIYVGSFNSYNTSTGKDTVVKLNRYVVRNGEKQTEQLEFKLSEQKFKYVSGSYTYAFCSFFETDNLNDFRILQNASYAYLRKSTSLSSSTTINRSTDTILKTMLKKYNIAENQLSMNNNNQLLPGVIGYGMTETNIGDGSIYNNLDDFEVMDKILNLTPVTTNNHNTYYRDLPSKNITNVNEKAKLVYLKENNNIGHNDYYIAKPNVLYHNATTKVRQYINSQDYDPINNVIVSVQYEYVDSVAKYTLVIENYETKEVLYQEDIVAMNYTYAGVSIVKGCAFLRTYVNDTKTWTIYKYDLSTLTKTTLDTFNTSSSSNTEVFKNNDEYILYQDVRQTGTKSIKCTTKMHFPESNKTLTLRNETVSTDRSTENYLYYVDLTDEIYILTECAYGAGYKLLLVNKNNYTITNMNLSYIPNRSSQIYDIPKNGYVDDNYVYFGWILLPKDNSGNTDNYSYVKIYDAEGNLIDGSEDTNNKHYTINNEHYVYTKGKLYKVDSYNVTKPGNYIIECICSKTYKCPGTTYFNYMLPRGNNGEYVSTSIYYDITSIVDNGDNYTFNILDDLTTGNIIMKQYDSSTSIDYDYSVIYTGTDAIIQSSVSDIFNQQSGPITQQEYDQALETANEIKGGTE